MGKKKRPQPQLTYYPSNPDEPDEPDEATPTTFGQNTKTNDEYILEEYNLELADDYQSPVSILPSRMTDSYKLLLLNRSLRKRDLDFLQVLPDDVSPNPEINQEYSDSTNADLIDKENKLRNDLQNDPTNDDIRNQLLDINKEQKSRAQQLAETLARDRPSSSLREPSISNQRTNQLNQQITDLENQLSRTPSGQERRDITQQLKNLEAEFELLTDPEAVSERIDRQINELRNPAPQLSPSSSSGLDLDFQQPSSSESIGSDAFDGSDASDEQSSSSSGLDFNDFFSTSSDDTEGEQKETSFDASKPDRTTNVPPATGASTLGEMFGDIIDKAAEGLGGLPTGGGLLSGDGLREPLVPRDAVPPPPSRQFIPRSTDPAEHEPTLGIQQSQNNPFIENGKEIIPDASIFRKMLHVGSQLSFDYLKNASPYAAQIELVEQGAKRLLGVEFGDVIDSAINAVSNHKTSDLGTMRTENPDRIKLNISDGELGEHATIRNPVLYPIMVIAFKFYLEHKEVQFGYMSGTVFKMGLNYVLKNFVKLPETNIAYFNYCWDNYPTELTDAYLANKNSIANVSSAQKVRILSYHKNIMSEYDRIFAPSKFMNDIRRYEHGGTEINEMLINLANPVFLFEVSKVFEGADEFILNVQNNQGLLMGLMGLLYSEAVNDGVNMGDALLSNARIDGIVYYNRQSSSLEEQNVEISLLQNATRELEVKDVNGIRYIILRGTDPKQKNFLKRDFMKNMLNLAGSPELFSDENFNSRIVGAIDVIDMTQRRTDMPIKIIGYSLGSVFALYLSSVYPEIPVEVYNPVLANNEATKLMMYGIEAQQSNLVINTIAGDPISTNVGQYKKRFDIREKKKSRFFNAHDLNNYVSVN
tara:strand:+ start:4110 stop:6728 length:2619 start_codon:yes stop_codon:yes gene_type:complete